MAAPSLPQDASLHGVDGTSPTDAWAVGTYSPSTLPPFIFHWDGRSWTESPQEPHPGAEVLYEVAAVATTDAWAVGYEAGVRPLVMHWDGTIWRHVTVPIPGTFNFAYDVAALSSNDVWVVGSYVGPQGLTAMVLHWDGTAWTLIPVADAPNGETFYAVWPAAADDVWGVGYTGGDIPGEFFPLTEHWDGVSWSIVEPEPAPSGDDNILYDVAGASSADVWTVGEYGDPNRGPLRPLAEHWDGTSWSLAHVPDRGGIFNTLESVSVVSSTDVWAAGQYTPNSDLDSPLLEHWDGAQWRQIKPAIPSEGGVFHSIAAVSASDVWAVGGYDPVGGQAHRPLIEHSRGC